jgi:hypothetical protein
MGVDRVRRQPEARTAGPCAAGAPTAARAGGRARLRGDLAACTRDDHRIARQARQRRATRPAPHRDAARQ